MTPIGKKEYTEKNKTPRCKCGSTKTVKAGQAKKKQRYKCTKCNSRFVIKTRLKIKHKKLKQELFVELYLEGLGFRSISRILDTNHVTLQNWLKEVNKKNKIILPLYSNAIEIDEIYFYTGKKKHKRWLWLAVCKESKRILAFQVGTRGKRTLSKLITKIKPITCNRYYTDEHVSFKGVLPKKKHTASKRYTYTVEGVNSAVRHYLARFRRRGKCYTKSECMLITSMELFIKKYNYKKRAA
jgi:insertion element IS1 protein InsB